MRSINLVAAAVAAAFLGGCASGDSPTGPAAPPALAVTDAGHNAADHFSGVEAVTFEVESPCNGELIVFTGENSYQMTFVDTRGALDAGHSVHAELQSHTVATGVGQTTGATYTIDDSFRQNSQSPSPQASQFVFSESSRATITSDVSGLSFSAHFVIRFTVLPSGEFKLLQLVDNFACDA